MNVLDLFSGIGGFSLGLERAGMRTVAFCEIDPYCRAVLRQHWPDVPIFGDVRELTAVSLGAHSAMWQQPKERKGDEASFVGRSIEPSGIGGLGIDVICGGFPCQDISVAGQNAGIEGARSGLWKEYARIIGEVRPCYVIVENVAALLGRGIERVLGDLAALGFDAEWHCIPASAVGAPHRRDRVWIVAYAAHRQPQERTDNDGIDRQRPQERWRSEQSAGVGAGGRVGNGDVAAGIAVVGSTATKSEGDVADANSDHGQRRIGALQVGRLGIAREIADHGDAGRTQWATEPDVGRVAHGVPARVDRLRALGNAVVPQIPELIGRVIMRAQP